MTMDDVADATLGREVTDGKASDIHVSEAQAADAKALEDLQTCLGYRFANIELLNRALIHASLTVRPSRRQRGRRAKSNNERLEFLGDRVLGLVIASTLLEAYPHDAEGRLTDRLVALVKRDALADVAQKIGLGRWLKLAPGEEGIGGRNNPGILADFVEALIGALFLDGGLEPAQDFIRKHWVKRIRAMRVPPRDPKMALQEWAHAHTGDTPEYAVIEQTGPDHAPLFTVKVGVTGHGEEIAIAGSKRAAQQAAAALMLQRLDGP